GKCLFTYTCQVNHLIEHTIRCFPHITNLACKAVLTAITDIRLAAVDDNTANVDGNAIASGPNRDLIALCRNTVRAIRSSSLRRSRFADLQRGELGNPILELLRDVDTRWSSTLLMLERFVELKQFIIKLISLYPELQRYKMTIEEWDRLDIYIKILRVPHAFQQMLSHEATPTLHGALPSFQKMINWWELYQHEFLAFEHIIEPGIMKLRDYIDEIKNVPAYTLAMGTCHYSVSYCFTCPLSCLASG
ncbi:hypothetical protein FA15DRAFT_604971, partial [Coprinopsis marcescibilis]